MDKNGMALAVSKMFQNGGNAVWILVGLVIRLGSIKRRKQMALNVYSERGMSLERQAKSFQQIVQKPYDKNSVDAYTRARIIWMYGTENEQWYFYHNLSRMIENPEIKKTIGGIRRTEDQQRSMISFLFDPKESIIERTIAYEQLAVDLTAAIAQDEPDPYVKQALEYALLEDFDHLFRYSVLLAREEKVDAHKIVQDRTLIKAGRPTAEEHLHPSDTLRKHVDRKTADPLSIVHIMSIVAPEQQTRQYYNSHGYELMNEQARQLYAEIGEIEEQHVTHYESLMDPNLTPLQLAFIHEYNEVYDYYSCLQMETDARFKSIWEAHLSQELEHLRLVGDLMRKHEAIEPQQMMPSQLPKPIILRPAKDYVDQVLQNQVNLRAFGMNFIPKDQLPSDWPSYEYLKMVDAANAPSTHFDQLPGQAKAA